MRRLAFLAALAAFAPGAALAAPAHWTVDPGSKIAFAGKMNDDSFTGGFSRWSADIAFDPKQLSASRVTVTIDVASASTGDADRDQAIPGADWFAAHQFPKATFTATQFKDLGGGRYEAIGDLAIRGVHRPVTLPFTLAIAGDKARMTGAVTLNRTAFGIGQGKWRTGDVVATSVAVAVQVQAHKAP
ncbi:MAG TPA: YceI family protein [Caulobacteraceae bacterium]|nr:YceI family protein [Caulobacteraceae bacterium]